MKMTEQTYQQLKSDIHAVITYRGQAADSMATLYDCLTPGLLWNAFGTAHLNRCYEAHPQIARDGRCLDHTGQHLYDLIYKVEDLDDSHVDTAFRRMIREWVASAT